ALYVSTEVAAQSFTGKHSSTTFVSLLRKHVVGSRVVKVWTGRGDRVVRIDFEKLDAGDNRLSTSLRLAFTGRSANAHLTDNHGEIIASLFDYDSSDQHGHPAALGALDPANLTAELNDSSSQSDVLDHFFGANSIFGPQLRNEFLARCADTTPSAAFKSLLNDLFEAPSQPLI